MNKKAVIHISGQVQGVSFREGVRMFAINLGLAGSATNLRNGEVEVVAEGEEEKIKELIEWCKRGPELARVEKIEVAWQAPSGLSGFTIRKEKAK